MAYTKLWHKIVTSSIWDADDQTRIVWITMLALANRDGFVEASSSSLALLSRVPRKDCEKALEVLRSPDPDSRTKADDGRRIEDTDGGWVLLNYEKYRSATSDDPHAVAAKERQRRHREKIADENTHREALCHVTSRDTASVSVSDSEGGSAEGGVRDVSGTGAVCIIADGQNPNEDPPPGVPPAKMPENGWAFEHVRRAAERAFCNPPLAKRDLEAYYDDRASKGWCNGTGTPVARTWRGLMADVSKWGKRAIDKKLGRR